MKHVWGGCLFCSEKNANIGNFSAGFGTKFFQPAGAALAQCGSTTNSTGLILNELTPRWHCISLSVVTETNLQKLGNQKMQVLNHPNAPSFILPNLGGSALPVDLHVKMRVEHRMKWKGSWFFFRVLEVLQMKIFFPTQKTSFSRNCAFLRHLKFFFKNDFKCALKFDHNT